MKKTLTSMLALITGLLMGCSSPRNPPATVQHVDLKKYMGKWYEIASFPNHFQKGCRCTTAQYTLQKNNVLVLNRCIKNNNKNFSTAKGKAWVPNENDNSKLKVRFFWPFSGNYWILYLESHYENVLVGSPNRKYLWILSRKKTMGDTTYQKIVGIAKEKGYDVNKLRKTIQNCTN